MAGKSPDAFRTISEVADWLDRPAHVLRFWESKFTQVKPVKRAGGRRYYRPEDMLLLGGIKKLLHDDGMTIKGAQKIIREQGVRYVSALSQPLDDDSVIQLDAGPVTAQVANRDTAPDVSPVTSSGVDPDRETRAKPVPTAPASAVLATPPTPSPDAAGHAPEVPAAASPPEDTSPAVGAVDDLPDPETAPVSGAPAEPQDSTPLDAPVANQPTDTPTPRAPLGADIPQEPVTDNAPNQPGVLALIAALRGPVSNSQRTALLPILDQLETLGARMGAARKG